MFYRIKNDNENLKSYEVEKIEPINLASLDIKESDLEKIIRNNIEILFSDEESLLVIGQQVTNEARGRSDLTAIDNEGNLVLIELKRDKEDITNRREAFEFQAIRYAASYATIKTPDDVVSKIFAPYIEKYRNEFNVGELTYFEKGIRILNEFLEDNEVKNNFNEKQRIILIASDFDEQTLSAVAWLNSNNVDISCFKFIPYKINNEKFLQIEKVLPTTNYEDYYVDIIGGIRETKIRKSKSQTRRSLPKIKDMLEWGVVKEGDKLKAKDRDSEVELLKNGNVVYNGMEMTIQSWLKDIFDWASVETYKFTIHKETGKSLKEIRKEYMEENED
jgi:hypothetical protein